MAGPTKAQIRAQLDELGVEQPASDATRDELLAVVAAHIAGVEPDADAPALSSSSSVRNVTVPRRNVPVGAAHRGTGGRRGPRCAGGRPLLTDDVCRQCLLAGATSCPES